MGENTELKTQEERFSKTSIIAVVAAALSFYVDGIMGLVFAGLAILIGLIGVLKSLSPTVRGGVMSTLSVIVGGIGVIAAIVKGIMWFFK